MSIEIKEQNNPEIVEMINASLTLMRSMRTATLEANESTQKDAIIYQGYNLAEVVGNLVVATVFEEEDAEKRTALSTLLQKYTPLYSMYKITSRINDYNPQKFYYQLDYERQYEFPGIAGALVGFCGMLVKEAGCADRPIDRRIISLAPSGYSLRVSNLFKEIEDRKVWIAPFSSDLLFAVCVNHILERLYHRGFEVIPAITSSDGSYAYLGMNRGKHNVEQLARAQIYLDYGGSSHTFSAIEDVLKKLLKEAGINEGWGYVAKT